MRGLRDGRRIKAFLIQYERPTGELEVKPTVGRLKLDRENTNPDVETVAVASEKFETPAGFACAVLLGVPIDEELEANVRISRAGTPLLRPSRANGDERTGRAFLHVMLRERGLTTAAALPISAGVFPFVRWGTRRIGLTRMVGRLRRM